MGEKNNTSKKRIGILLVVFLILSIAALVRLFYLQVLKHDEFSARALGQINRSQEISSNRGRILDTNGRNLAINETVTTVNANPSQMIKASKDQVAKELAPLLGYDEKYLRNILDTDKSVKLKQYVSMDIGSQIEKLNLNGISLESTHRRYYPLGQIGSDIIGFVNIDGQGQYGIEASFDEELRGTPGRIFKSSDSKNRQIPTGEQNEFVAEDGMSVVLTIDENIQKIAYDEATKIVKEFGAKSADIIVQDSKNGDILAMVSSPTYDNNNPRDPISSKQRSSWSNKNNVEDDWYANWTNSNISNNYEPGSTFKLITAASALEENETSPSEQYYCTGYIRDINNAPVIRCVSHDDPHGDINMAQAMAKSCNASFVYMARDLGKEAFLEYIDAFGFGKETGIELNAEAEGIVPKSHTDISDLDLATMSYGHGIAVTPIQLVNAVNAFANEGMLLKPRLVKEFIDVDGTRIINDQSNQIRQVVSSKTANTMLELMQTVVDEGTGTRAKSSKYTIGGKTGTAVKPSASGGYADEYISSFVGIAPIEDPQITVLVAVDSPQKETYGSLVAAPHAKNLIERVLEYKAIDYSKEASQETNELIEVPDVSYRSLGDAGTRLTSEGLRYTTDYIDIDQTTIVRKQNPKAGSKVEEGTIIELEITNNSGDKLLTPNLLNLTLDEASSIIENMGLDFEYSNKGRVVDQDPKAGQRIKPGQKIDLILDDLGDDQTSEESKFKDDISQEEQIKETEDKEEIEKTKDK